MRSISGRTDSAGKDSEAGGNVPAVGGFPQPGALKEGTGGADCKKAGLWLDSGDIFGAAGRGFERIIVACPRSVLTEALERLARAVRECVK